MASAENSNVRQNVDEKHNRVEQDTEITIDLVELLYRLLEHWKWIVSSALICAVAFFAYTTASITPTYQATSKIYVLNPSDSAINISDLQLGSSLANDYLEIFKTWEMHEMVIKNLNLDYSYNQMQSMLSVSNPKDTRVLYITVTSADPKLAMNIANEYATAAQRYISDTMATDEPNMFSAALEPTTPIGPSKTRNTMLGFLLGAMLAIGIVTVRFVMDDKIKTAEDISKYANLPTLAVVPVLSNSGKKNNASGAKKRR